MIIIGTGAQAKYVVDILRSTKRSPQLYVFNLPEYDNNKMFYNFKVNTFGIEKIGGFEEVVICSKDSFLKEKIYLQLQDKHITFSSMIHSRAYVSDYTTIFPGVIINPNATIHPQSEVGMFSMIHSGVIVEHNCILEPFVNLAPGVTLAGGVKVGKHTQIYTGAIIGPNVKIGERCVIGAGTVLLHDLDHDMMIYNEPSYRQGVISRSTI